MYSSSKVFLFIFSFAYINLFAQMPGQFGTFQPIQPNQSYNQNNNGNPFPQNNNNGYGSMLQPKRADQMIQYGDTYTNPQDQQRKNEARIKAELMKQPGYYNPNAENKFNQLSPAQRENYNIVQSLNQVASINSQMKASNYYQSSKYKTDSINYRKSMNALKDMLSGKRKLSLREAYYIEESAYGGLHMTYEEYSKNITESAAFIKQWLTENGYSLKNQEALHLGIQKFMGDTLYVSNKKPDSAPELSPQKGHKPYFYDYIDYRGEEDLHNYFLTKTLATGTGQCNTLPRVYLVLAEALGANAYLTFAPQHSFIKYKNNKGVIQNYEPTIDWHMSDQDYTEQLPVMSTAIKNRIYLDTLNKKQIIASTMIDLAYDFTREHWIADGKFVNDCVDYAMNFFYKKEGNREGLLIKGLVLASKFDKTLVKYKITNLEDIEKYPEAVNAYLAYRDNTRKIAELGIQDFPENKYMEMLEKHDGRGKLQVAKSIDTKSKKNLFFTLEN